MATKKTQLNIEVVEPEKIPDEQQASTIDPNDINQFVGFLNQMKFVKATISGVPTFAPKTFFDQIQFYDNGSIFRIYIYMNGTWRYVSLT